MTCDLRLCALLPTLGLICLSIALGGGAQTVPADVEASDGRHTHRVEITWDDVQGAKGYEIARNTPPSRKWTTIGGATGTSFEDTDVAPCEPYQYKVRAWDGLNWSDYSDPDAGYARGEAPAVPLDISVVVSEKNEVLVSWSAVAQAARYKVFRAEVEEGPYAEIGAVAVPEFGDRLASPCARYWYCVSACGICGCGAMSPAATWTVDAAFARATSMVVDDILPKVIPTGAQYLCARMDGALPAGSLIEEDVPANGSVKPQGTAISDESFLFFVDLAPGMYYEHAVKYILVSRCGTPLIIDAAWWPKVSGQTVEAFRDLTPASGYVLAGRIGDRAWGRLDDATAIRPEDAVWTRTGEGNSAQAGALGHISPEWREAFLVVQGVLPTEDLFGDATATSENGATLFGSYTSGVSQVQTLTGADAARTLDVMHSLAESGFSPITVYIISHGGVDSVRLGGIQFGAQQFRDEVAGHPDVVFNFLIGSCHSSSFIDDLNTLTNVAVVEAACAADAASSADWDYYGDLVDYNVEDTGSEWTSSVLAATTLIVENRWSEVLAEAALRGVSATSVLMHAAGLGAIGQYPLYGLTDDLDFSHRVGATAPACCGRGYDDGAWCRP